MLLINAFSPSDFELFNENNYNDALEFIQKHTRMSIEYMNALGIISSDLKEHILQYANSIKISITCTKICYASSMILQTRAIEAEQLDILTSAIFAPILIDNAIENNNYNIDNDKVMQLAGNAGIRTWFHIKFNTQEELDRFAGAAINNGCKGYMYSPAKKDLWYRMPDDSFDNVITMIGAITEFCNSKR